MMLWMLQTTSALALAVVAAAAAGVAAEHGLLVAQLVLAGAVATPLVLTLLAGAGLGQVIEPWHIRRSRAELLRAHICPSCRYCLAFLEPDGEGVTVCPECGSGWRMSNPDERIRFFV